MQDEKSKEAFRPYPDWKMYGYTPARGEWNACVYYRQWVPFSALQELGLMQSWVDRGQHHYDKDEREQQALRGLLTSDIALLYGMTGASGEAIQKVLHGMNPGTLNGKLVYPPSVVYDIDDNLDFVHPFNPTYAVYGVRAMDGHVLKPGEDVAVRLANGKEILLWQDRFTKGDKGWLFDVERNLASNALMHKFAKACNGFTTPSNYLRKYMIENYGYPEGYVYPNSIVPGDWPAPKFAPRKKEVRLIWQGGGSHMSDWYALKPAIKYIAKKYPNVKFVLFGTVFDWIGDAIPEGQLEKHEWVGYDGYKATRALLDGDINMCVLRNDEFSRSKSAIKFYEGSMGATPEATIAPNMPPYSEEIIDGETGVLYDVSGTPEQAAESFAANLEHLIKNVEFRRQVGANAKKWVLENRHYHKTAAGLYDYYHELRLRMQKDKPYDPEADKLPPKIVVPELPSKVRAKKAPTKSRKKK